MSLDRVTAGSDVPNDCNVVIEIPMRADPIKYEVDKATGAVFVDRFMSTAMHYPCNYGYIPCCRRCRSSPVSSCAAVRSGC
jgi:inorganic pyrophosphatase